MNNHTPTPQNPILKSESGFTLVEMLIVIAIIGVIMTIIGTNVISRFDRAKVDSTKIQMKQLQTVLDQFRIDCGFYPTTDQGLEALISKPGGRECRNYDPSGYLNKKEVPKDSFGFEFEYTSDGNNYEIISRGSDGVEGGEGNNADISSNDLD